MEKKVFSVNNEEIRNIDLSDEVFNCDISEGTIYYAIKCELANKRVGTASTKTRSEVRGSKTKPWKQKGTGRARAGRRRSPVWVGGGIVFGPKPRDFSYAIPKKMKRAAIKSILSMKAQSENIKVIEDFTVESGKTKDLVGILKKIGSDERTVIILPSDDKLLKRAGSNLPNVSFLTYNRLNAHDLFYGKNLLMLESSVKNLNEFYSNNKVEN